MDWVNDQAGPFDALVCCAGVMGNDAEMRSLATDQWEQVIATNLTGTFNCLREITAKRIICFAGGGAPGVLVGHGAYNVSKTAVISLVQNYAAENPNVTINAVSPGAFQTGMSKVGETDATKLLKLIDWLLVQDRISGRCISLNHDKWESLEWVEQMASFPDLGTLIRKEYRHLFTFDSV